MAQQGSLPVLTAERTENRVAELATRICFDMSERDTEGRAKLMARSERFVDTLCPVTRSLNYGVTTDTEVRCTR